MKKKILVMILAVCMAITAMTVVSFGETYGDFVYTYKGYNQVSITGNNGVAGNITIPSLINGYLEVVAIGDYAFYGNDGITSVTIPDTVKTIGEGAFTGCGRLASVTFPNGLKEIDTGAFRGTQITSVTLSCGTTYESNSFPTGCTIIQPDHTYSIGVCSVCGASEPDSIYVGSLKLHDGYYTTDGSTEIAGKPDSTATSYAYYADGTLTLCGYAATSTISYGGDLKIVLIDENSVTVTNGDGISATGNLTISGTGSLEVTTSSDNGSNFRAIISTGGSVTISGTTVKANADVTRETGMAYAIYAYTDVTITDSTVNTKAISANNTSYAIYSSGDVKITEGSKVTAESKGAFSAEGFYCSSNIVIEGNSTVSITVTSTSSNGYARDIYAKGNITITDSAIKNAEANGYSHDAIVCRGTSGITFTNSEAVIVGGIVVDGSFTVTPTTGSVLEVQIGTSTTYCSSATKIDSTTATVTIKAHTHTYDAGVVTTEPTCTETGVKTYTCSVCGDSYTEAVSASGHSYTVTACDWSSDYASATLTLTCDNCSDEQTVVATEIESEVTTAAQCEDEGAVLYTAKGTYNNVEYAYSVTVASSATGHTFGTPEIVWTSESTATASVACSECGAIEPLEVTVTSTTDSYGNTIYTATVTYNGQTYTSEQTVEAVKTTTSKSEIYTTLSRIQASYTGVQAAIAKANSLNPDDYENFSAVTEAIEAVDWSLSALNQKQVNSYAEAIEEAIENLIPASTTEEVIEIDEPVEAGETDSE